MNTDEDLQVLLDLDRQEFILKNGFCAKIRAWKVKPSEQIPHGIRYSLTLHDRNNTRILGYDNAEAPPKPKHKQGRYGTKKTVVWDHMHRYSNVYPARMTVTPYTFETASGLLADFWQDVDKILGD